EILRRLDAAYRSIQRRSLEGRVLGRSWAAMPEWGRSATREPLAALLRTRRKRRQLTAPRDHDTEDERRAQAFFTSPNNFAIGGVRFNLQGREEQGIVRPGPEFDQLRQRLEADLLALVNVDTGTPVVERVERSDDHYQRASLDALPDLFVYWRQGIRSRRSGP